MDKVVIVGCGAAGLSAAIQLAEENVPCLILAETLPERAQSNMAEGGINAALDTMGQSDSPDLHEKETYKAGRFLADRRAVHRLTHGAPGVVESLYDWGMALNITDEKKIALRPFGGQTKKRTAFASASTGKQLMYTLATAARRFQENGMIQLVTGQRFLKLFVTEDDHSARGVVAYDKFTGRLAYFPASGVIMASGGMNAIFGNATGSVLNTCHVTSGLYADYLEVANPEMIQYHPTTVHLRSKNMLITEAVRGEGGRLYVEENGKRSYFMEEKYPELGNLMPRDVIAREEWQWIKRGIQPYLDMTEIPHEVSRKKLTSVLEACHDFMALDPLKEPIPVSPGIHYFMGGIRVDLFHRTAVKNLYAAGEAACQYHGANRLGGNSLLGAMFGGRTAAKAAMEDLSGATSTLRPPEKWLDPSFWLENEYTSLSPSPKKPQLHLPSARGELNRLMQRALGIERSEEELRDGIAKLEDLAQRTAGKYDESAHLDENVFWPCQLLLSRAILEGAIARRESRGAHTRTDCPGEHEEYRKTTVAKRNGQGADISFAPLEDGEDPSGFETK